MKKLITVFMIILVVIPFSGCFQDSSKDTETKKYSQEVVESINPAIDAAQKYIDNELSAPEANDIIRDSQEKIKNIKESEENSLNKIGEEYLYSCLLVIESNIVSIEHKKSEGLETYSISGEIQKKIDEIKEELKKGT